MLSFGMTTIDVALMKACTEILSACLCVYVFLVSTGYRHLAMFSIARAKCHGYCCLDSILEV